MLRVAFENFLLGLGGHLEATEITGDDSTLSLLKAKGQRFGLALEGNAAFTKIQEVSGVPDIGAAFAARQLQAAQLLALRHSKHAQALRDWFADGQPNDSAQDTLRRYVDSIGKPTWIDALPMKLIRFATTAGLGVVEPVTGSLASAADSFLSSWFPRKSPRLFSSPSTKHPRRSIRCSETADARKVEKLSVSMRKRQEVQEVVVVVDEPLGRRSMNYRTILAQPWSWELRAPLVTGSNHDRDPVPEGASVTEAARSRDGGCPEKLKRLGRDPFHYVRVPHRSPPFVRRPREASLAPGAFPADCRGFLAMVRCHGR